MRRLSTGPLPGARDSAQPLLTLLAGGARVELSGATAGNWRAKTANLLQSLGPPARVGLLLPLHWQTVTLLLGTVAAGATAVLARDVTELADCDVAFVTSGDAAAALEVCAGDVLAVSTAPLGGRLRDLPTMVLDAGTELPGHGDVLAVPPPSGWSVELAGQPVRGLPDLGLGPGDRVLTVLGPATEDGLVLGLLVPLLAGAALVLVPGEVPPGAPAAERVTATVGVHVPGLPRLDVPRPDRPR